MAERRVDVFFYGLFMDPDVLAASGVHARNARRAHVDHYALRIGARATLVPAHDARVHGMVYALSHQDLQTLYGAPGLEAYRPEEVVATLDDAEAIPAVCYNLPRAPSASEANAEYAARLRHVLAKLGFPSAYRSSIE